MPERAYVFQQAVRDGMPLLQHRDSHQGEEGDRTDGDRSGGGAVLTGRASGMRLDRLHRGSQERERL